MINYLTFKKYITRLRVFFLWPLAIVYLISQIFLYDSYWWVLAGIALYYPFHQLGYSIGGHKMFTHRAFESNNWYPYVSVILTSICFFGSPMGLAISHREHHRYADTNKDPHNPAHGRWHAFMGWIWSYKIPPPDAKVAADLNRDYPFIKKYDRIEWLVLPTFFIIVSLVSKGLFLACLLASVLSFFVGMCVNGFSHNPSILEKNKAINSIWLAKYVNPIFLHYDHHINDSLWDYSTADVKDFSAWFIKRFLMKRNNTY